MQSAKPEASKRVGALKKFLRSRTRRIVFRNAADSFRSWA